MKTLLPVLLMVCAAFLSGCDQPTTATETTSATTETATPTSPQRADYAIVIHGGAGTILKKNMTDERETSIRAALTAALDRGEALLQAGTPALDVVVETIKVLEDSPHFNAGKGAVFTSEGVNELDASIMNGADLQAGAVGGVRTVRNPITAARAVLDHSPHVLLTGAGADAFAREQGLDLVDNKYFYTQERYDALRARQAEEAETGSVEPDVHPDYKYGTVGCVVLDKNGNLAAGTSTGGMTNKKYNRIGDSPIIGAGTYANNATCAVSSTGHGEYFIRYAVAYDINALMAYKDLALADAADLVINDKLKKADGTGGVIAVDRYGNVAMPFNTPGMYRGYAKPGERVVGIYGE